MNYFDDDDRGARRWPKVVIACLVGVVVVGAGVWFLTRPGDEQTGLDSLPASPVEFDGQDTTAPSTQPSAVVSAASAAPVGAGTVTPAGSAVTTAASATTASTSPTSSTAVVVPASSPVDSAPATSTGPVETTVATAGPDGSGPYPTSPDGSPLPVIVTYDVDTITLTGFVPSQAAKDRLGQLAVANSKTEAQLENDLVINPDVPIGVGVRVIELNSVRFPEGSSEILPDHGTELERVARVMQALPNVTVLVIGHADQRGDDIANYEISAERAEAVVEFLTYLGVSPTRLSSRAVGEADLLTLADDDTALALNRRTEFVFYGLLIE